MRLALGVIAPHGQWKSGRILAPVVGNEVTGTAGEADWPKDQHRVPARPKPVIVLEHTLAVVKIVWQQLDLRRDGSGWFSRVEVVGGGYSYQVAHCRPPALRPRSSLADFLQCRLLQLCVGQPAA